MFLQICSATAGLSSAGFVIPRIIICILLTARSIFAEVFFRAKWRSLITPNHQVWGPIFYRNRLIHAEAGVTGNLRDVVMTTMHVTWRVNVFRTAFEALQSLRLKQWCIDIWPKHFMYLELFSAVPFCINKIDRKIDVQRNFIAYFMNCRMSF